MNRLRFMRSTVDDEMWVGGWIQDISDQFLPSFSRMIVRSSSTSIHLGDRIEHMYNIYDVLGVVKGFLPLTSQEMKK